MTAFTFPAPARLLTLNDRLHYHQRNNITQAWRQAAATHARQAGVPKLDRAHITITLAFPTGHHRDVHNWTTTAKAIVDGLVTDYGLLPNDCDCYLTLDIRRGPKTAEKTAQIEVRIDPNPSDSTGRTEMPQTSPESPREWPEGPSRAGWCPEVKPGPQNGSEGADR